MSDERTEQLDGMLKAGLYDECLRLDALLAKQGDHVAAIDDGLLEGFPILSVHVSGAPWAGTEVRLVRCAVRGEDADKWMVFRGGKMLTTKGLWLAGARPFYQIKPQLQRLLMFSVADALAAAKAL